jgi:3-hydroxyisobutyrate dehydrogenase-like beta-hydroxyacid dehydrogenase
MSMVPPPGPASTMGVAFLGAAASEVGAMAAPMATNIAKKGFPIAAWNRSSDRSAALAALGVKMRGSPRECVQGARVVILLLADESSLFDVLERADGVLAGIEKDAVIVDMSTVGRAAALKAADLAKSAGARFIDAPVSGSVGHAERGELTALVGGRLNDVSRAQPVIQAMTKKIIHAGDVGQGQALKIVLNALGAHQLAAFTSMLVLGERAGLARRVVIDAFTTGVFAAPSYIQKREKMLAKDYSPELTLAVGLKEAQLNIELQQEVGLPLPVQREITRALEKAVEDGFGEEDLYALEKYYRSL